MITFFTTAKPFKAHDGVIQRNALKSWTLLHPDVEVILFGDDEGAAEVCAELGLRHEPHVERHESGAKYLSYMFDRAQKITRHGYLCYSNCDIIFTDDIARAVQTASAWRKRFLMVAQRWDTDITQPLDFARPDWGKQVRSFAKTTGFQRSEHWIDVFLFTKGLYLDMPPLIVGHCYWDNWMIWKAVSEGVPVLDASDAFIPVHQNHGYNPKFQRHKGLSNDPLSIFNLGIIGGPDHAAQINDAGYRMTRDLRIRITFKRQKKKLKKAFLSKLYYPVWHWTLDMSRPVRTVLGLRSKAARQHPKA